MCVPLCVCGGAPRGMSIDVCAPLCVFADECVATGLPGGAPRGVAVGGVLHGAWQALLRQGQGHHGNILVFFCLLFLFLNLELILLGSP